MSEPIPAELEYAGPHTPRQWPTRGQWLGAGAIAAVTLLFVLIFWSRLSGLQLLIIALLGGLVALLPLSVKWATTYGRVTVLVIVATIMMLPFAWLVTATVKDKKVLNEYTFLPPPTTWGNEYVQKGSDFLPLSEFDDARVEELRAADAVAEAQAEESQKIGAVSDVPDVIFHFLNLNNYKKLFAERETVQGTVSFWRYVVNSVFLASATTIISLVFCSMGGYALAKYQFRGQGPILTFMLASLTIPGVVLLAPNYEVIYRLGMMDTYWALIVPACVNAFGIFLFRQALMGVPKDLVEAGRIDGASEFSIYYRLAMPLVRPMTGAFCLITFLASWNNFLAPNIFLQTQTKLPLPVVLNQYISEYTQQYGVFLAGTLLAIIPPAILFFALQKEFIAGLTSGAVKQ